MYEQTQGRSFGNLANIKEKKEKGTLVGVLKEQG
jgi:hypothetical protein